MLKKMKVALALSGALATSLGFSGSALASPPAKVETSSISSSAQSSQSPDQLTKQLAAIEDVKRLALDRGNAGSTSSLSATSAKTTGPVNITQQCDLPVSQRTGAWTCLGAPDQQGSSQGRASSTPDLTVSAAQPGGYCLTFAPECWGVNNDFNAEFDGKNTYGFKDKVLGSLDMETTWQLSGGQSVSNPVVATFTDPVRDLVFETDRLYYDKYHRSGEYFNPGKHAVKTWSTGIGQKKWPNGGAKLYENSVSLGGVMQTFSWHVPGYTGAWVIYVKSPQFQKDGNVYRYMSAHNLPEDAWNAYWNPAG